MRDVGMNDMGRSLILMNSMAATPSWQPTSRSSGRGVIVRHRGEDMLNKDTMVQELLTVVEIIALENHGKETGEESHDAEEPRR